MKVTVHPTYTHLHDFIYRLPFCFDREGEMLHDGRNKVKRFLVNGEKVIAKRYKRPHIIQQISYSFFRMSKAKRAYLFAEKFRQCGFDTPHEIAYIEINRHGLFSDSFFVSTQCPDPSLYPLLNKEGFDRHIADELAALLVSLHQKGILHGDLNLTNILYHSGNGKFHFTLIDTNRSKFRSSPSQDMCMKNLRRLTHNKELYHYIITRYAILREWDPEECLTSAMKYLAKLEQKEKRKHKIQSIKKRK